MRVDIWSDVICPWCYIGKRRFESALGRFAYREEVEIVWHSFELDPSAPARREGSLADLLSAKYGMSHQQALDANDNITALAAAEGLDYHLERARPGNTFAAHRLLHLARDHGLQGEMKERLLRGYFSDGMAVGEVDGLLGAGVDIGLDKDEVLAVLETDAYADAVCADEAEASRLGISGVPFFVLERRYGISGAQAPDTLLAGLDQAWKSRGPSGAGDPAAGGGAGGPDRR
ncbi:MAG TPA: DsbA family oxidoreductase [Acidimicrobiales bacterium]|jgi:predicted DsbA family dithiol-disulfide isomerase